MSEFIPEDFEHLSDPIDQGCINEQRFTASAVNEIRNKAELMERGSPGECQQCGEDMPRLVNKICCPCRDRFQR